MVSDWREENNKLIKDFRFETFKEALNFVNRVADLAEKMNHHPDILIHDYKYVKITLVTHKENKITNKDYQLATNVDSI